MREALRQWVAHGLTLPGKTKGGLAKKLGRKSQAVVTHILDGTRQIKAHEIKLIEEYLGTQSPRTPGLQIVITNSAEEEKNSTGIKELDARAGMGGGGVESTVVVRNGQYTDAVKPEEWNFPISFVRAELRAPPNRLLVLETQGDSMSPTIEPGERVIVDTGHILPSPDGIYAIRDQFGAIQVKRLQVLRRGDSAIRIISDNDSHQPEDVGLDEIAIVGRVVCSLKRF